MATLAPTDNWPSGHAIEACGETPQYLPPYSHHLNPIEPAWGGLVKRRVRTRPREDLRVLKTTGGAAGSGSFVFVTRCQFGDIERTT